MQVPIDMILVLCDTDRQSRDKGVLFIYLFLINGGVQEVTAYLKDTGAYHLN